VELKVDYTESYEKIRIKNNYPRASGEELDQLWAEIRDEDPDFVKDCLEATVENLNHNLAFLEVFVREIDRRGNIASTEAQQRALFVAIVSLARLGEGASPSHFDLLRKLADMMEPADKLHLYDQALFRHALQKSLGVESRDEFLARLDAMCDPSALV
jgi:hypothetical protein